MQPSNSLIALGVGTVLAVSAATSSTQAAPLVSQRHVRSAADTPEKLAASEAGAFQSIAQTAAKETPPQHLEAAQKLQVTAASNPAPIAQSAPTSQPPAATPSPSGSSAGSPSTDSPSTDSPSMELPQAAPTAPSMPLPRSRTPGNATPGNATPGTSGGTATPETPPPGSMTPGTITPGTMTPGTTTPGTSGSTATPGTATNSEPAPEYLNPDPNPLSFPTTPEEVQIAGTQPITLRQAIELAIRNTRSLQQSRLQLERAQAALRESEAQNFPTLQLQSGVGFQVDEQANAVRAITGTTTGFNGTTFNNSTTLNGTLTATYNLFTAGQRSASIAAARGQVRAQELQLEADTEQLILDVTNNYYDLQQADEQVRISQASLTEAQRSLRDAQALERAGVGTRFDVLQAEVDVANAQQDLTQQISAQEIARRQLVQQLSLSQSIDISAADPIDVAGLWDLTLQDTIVLAFKNRAELEQQLVQREIAQQNRRGALAQLAPQISLSASYGFLRTLDSSTSPNFDGFLSNARAQIGLNWNIFDGGAARAQARQAESNIAIAENQFASNREQIRFLIEQAYSTLRSSYDNIQVTSRAVLLATESLRLARLRFQAGVGTQTDVLQQQTALTRSEVNRLTAILNYNRALASLKRQVSNYPQGDLANTP
ncbi:MAG TPA: TolC family protein [Coleofasciculaceae cyanobacterium]